MEVQSVRQRNAELQQQLETSESEKQTVRQQLTRAEETIRIGQLQIQEMRLRVSLMSYHC